MDHRKLYFSLIESRKAMEGCFGNHNRSSWQHHHIYPRCTHATMLVNFEPSLAQMMKDLPHIPEGKAREHSHKVVKEMMAETVKLSHEEHLFAHYLLCMIWMRTSLPEGVKLWYAYAAMAYDFLHAKGRVRRKLYQSEMERRYEVQKNLPPFREEVKRLVPSFEDVGIITTPRPIESVSKLFNRAYGVLIICAVKSKFQYQRPLDGPRPGTKQADFRVFDHTGEMKVAFQDEFCRIHEDTLNKITVLEGVYAIKGDVSHGILYGKQVKFLGVLGGEPFNPSQSQPTITREGE